MAGTPRPLLASPREKGMAKLPTARHHHLVVKRNWPLLNDEVHSLFDPDISFGFIWSSYGG